MNYKYADFPKKNVWIDLIGEELPFFGQNPELVKKWVIANEPQVGDCMVCVTSYGDLLEYFLAEINGIQLKKFRCLSFVNATAYHPSYPSLDSKGTTIEHGSWFYRNGRNVEEPNGQIRILAPTEKLIQLFVNNQANHIHIKGFGPRV
jgi:hypothetical protein